MVVLQKVLPEKKEIVVEFSLHYWIWMGLMLCGGGGGGGGEIAVKL